MSLSKSPGVAPEEWSKSDDGRDFSAELLYHAEEKTKSKKTPVTRGEIGNMLLNFGVTATGEYIAHFKNVLKQAGHKVV